MKRKSGHPAGDGTGDSRADELSGATAPSPLMEAISALTAHIERLHSTVSDVVVRLGGMDARVQALEGDVRALGAQVDARLDAVDTQLSDMGTGLKRVDVGLDDVKERLVNVEGGLVAMAGRLTGVERDLADARIEPYNDHVLGRQGVPSHPPEQPLVAELYGFNGSPPARPRVRTLTRAR